MQNQNEIKFSCKISNHINDSQLLEGRILEQSIYGEDLYPLIEQFISMNNASQDNLKYLIERLNK